jgi:glycosyltransferase involved in cell wall biosynthesis
LERLRSLTAQNAGFVQQRPATGVVPCAVRVAIDIRKLHDFGIGTYIRNLLRHLARLDCSSEFVLFCHPRDLANVSELGPNFRGVAERSAPYSLREQISLPLLARREQVDVYHAPHYVLPTLMPCPSVVTIHDCIHLMFPEYLPYRVAKVYARAAMYSATHRANRILTVSESSKRDILRFFPVPPEQIVVIYNAIDERFKIPPPPDAVARIRERYQLEDPFVLYVGNVKPHKNVVRLIEAFALMRRQRTDGLKLVIIGDEISKFQTLRRAVLKHKLHKHVRFLGFVPDGTLSVLYRLASVFVFPSIYEGFGLPPLEAMACGTPVITSNVSSLPEVTGGAALLVDPYSAGAIAEAIERVLSDPALAADLRVRGLARSQDFSWEQSVARTLDIYREVASGR